jgi:hypothetical protein
LVSSIWAGSRDVARLFFAISLLHNHLSENFLKITTFHIFVVFCLQIVSKCYQHAYTTHRKTVKMATKAHLGRKKIVYKKFAK